MTALDVAAEAPRWVAWRNEDRGGRLTKIPYGPRGGKAKADDPATWGTRAEAEAKAAEIVEDQGGGIGIELGDFGCDTYLAGIDLDSCLSDKGVLAPWAAEILRVVQSYTEVSPSGRGLKVFFYVASEDVRPFLEQAGIVDPEQWGFKRSIGEDGRHHGPAVEVYLARRYFTVTGDTWMTQPDQVMLLDWPTLEHLAQLIPPARAGKPGADNSRSAIAFRKASHCAVPVRHSSKCTLLCAPIPKQPSGYARRARRAVAASCAAFGIKQQHRHRYPQGLTTRSLRSSATKHWH